jgi:uncharacterized membrane protein YfcA
MLLLTLFLVSMVAGALGALLGLGGGVILVPALTLLGGIDIHYAIGASIVSVIATSSGAAATYVRDRITNLRLGMFLEMATTTGAVAGALVAGLLPGPALSAIFGLVLLQAAWSSFQARDEDAAGGVSESRLAARLRLGGSYYDPALRRQVDYGITGVPQGFALMWLAGLISGLLGVGSGVFKVLAMDRMMHAPIKVSTTTSNFMIGVTAAASAGIYFLRGDVHPVVAAPVALGTLLGTTVGTRLLLQLRGGAIRRVFVVVLVLIALEMTWQGVRGIAP